MVAFTVLNLISNSVDVIHTSNTNDSVVSFTYYFTLELVAIVFIIES